MPKELQQRVLLYGIVGALALRGIFIALGAAALKNLSWAILLFGAILLVTAVKVLRDQKSGHGNEVDVSSMRSVKLLRRFMPVTDFYHGPRTFVQETGMSRGFGAVVLTARHGGELLNAGWQTPLPAGSVLSYGSGHRLSPEEIARSGAS